MSASTKTNNNRDQMALFSKRLSNAEQRLEKLSNQYSELMAKQITTKNYENAEIIQRLVCKMDILRDRIQRIFQERYEYLMKDYMMNID